MDRKVITRLAALPLAALAFGACESTTDIGGDAAPRVSVLMTDAPGDVESVWIDIDGVVLIGDATGETSLSDGLDELLELTELVGRTQEIVDDFELESDRFGQLRLLLGGAVLLTKDGQVFATQGAELPDGVSAEDVGTLQCPSCSQSGLKVVLHGQDAEMEEGDDVALVLDFDVAQSFGHQAGQSGRWVMHPVIHATRVADDDAGDGSSIQGTVAIQTDGEGAATFDVPACPAGTARSIADFVPTATAATLLDDEGAAVVRSGVVDATAGTFSIGFVVPDSYAMGWTEVELGDFKLVWTAEVTPASVVVEEDADVTGVAYTLTGASCVAND